MLKHEDIKIGQKLLIKSLQECINQKLVTNSTNGYRFINVEFSPGLTRAMESYFGNSFTVLNNKFVRYYIQFKEIRDYAWPIEVLSNSLDIKKLKII